MKDIKNYLIKENRVLNKKSIYDQQSIIDIEKLYANMLVGVTFSLTYKCSKPKLGNTDLNSYEFNPMSKELNHVIAHLIESYLNPEAILKYSSKVTDKLDIDLLEIKTSDNDLTDDGKTPNNQKLYFSSISQYNNLKQENAILLYIYYELNNNAEATIKKVYVRTPNMIEATSGEKIDKEGNISKRKPTNMCITKLTPITKGNGEI